LLQQSLQRSQEEVSALRQDVLKMEHREDTLSKECQRLTAAVEQVDLQRDDVQVVLDEQTVLLQTNGQRLRETQEELARCHSQYDALVATHQETVVVLEQKTQSFSRLRQEHALTIDQQQQHHSMAVLR